MDGGLEALLEDSNDSNDLLEACCTSENLLRSIFKLNNESVNVIAEVLALLHAFCKRQAHHLIATSYPHRYWQRERHDLWTDVELDVMQSSLTRVSEVPSQQWLHQHGACIICCPTIGNRCHVYVVALDDWHFRVHRQARPFEKHSLGVRVRVRVRES